MKSLIYNYGESVKNRIKNFIRPPIEFASIKYFDSLLEAKLWHLTNVLYYDCELVPTYIEAHSVTITSVQYYFQFARYKDYFKYYLELTNEYQLEHVR